MSNWPWSWCSCWCWCWWLEKLSIVCVCGVTCLSWLYDHVGTNGCQVPRSLVWPLVETVVADSFIAASPNESTMSWALTAAQLTASSTVMASTCNWIEVLGAKRTSSCLRIWSPLLRFPSLRWVYSLDAVNIGIKLFLHCRRRFYCCDFHRLSCRQLQALTRRPTVRQSFN